VAQARSHRFKFAAVACVVAALAVSAAVLFTTDVRQLFGATNSSARNDTEFDALFRNLRQEFPSQTRRLWAVVESGMLPIVEEDDPAHPAVILLAAAQPGTHPATECLARRFAALVTASLHAQAEHTTYDCRSAADRDAAKSQIDTQLTRAFDAGTKSAVVLHLEQLPGQSAMIFYRFADNDNAPFKKVVIVLTLVLESADIDAASESDSVVFDELRRVWSSSVDADQVDPLLSRIGNSVAFVRPEDAQVLAELDCSS